MKLAVVVQRYGAEISGGAELHARYIAEHLAKHAEVEVFTTCARDYIAWRNEFPAGTGQLNDLLLRRFPVSRERRPKASARRSEQVFHHTHSLDDELAWIRSEGPTSPSLVRYIQSQRGAVRFLHLLQLPLLPRLSRRPGDRLKAEADKRSGRRSRLEPLPGWIARRQKRIPASAEVVAQLPRGPSRSDKGE